jgi:hypothetical protein
MVRVVYKDRRSSTRGSVGDNVRLRMGGTRKANFCSDGQFLFAAMAVPVLRAAASPQGRSATGSPKAGRPLAPQRNGVGS